MRLLTSSWIPLTVGIAASIAIATQPLHAELIEMTKKVAGTTVHYKVVLPNGYDPGRAYPGILAFGGGPQTMNTVDGILMRNFRAEAEKRGYIVVAPAAPDGQLFFEGGARIVPEFLKMVLADYKIQGGKFHLAGPSNGGIAAFHVAAANPQYFLSVTAFPGYMWQPSTATLFPEDPPRFLARTPHGYYDRPTIERDLAGGGFTASPTIATVAARSHAKSPRVLALAYCQGTPLRDEIDARDASRLAEATDIATEMIAQRFGRETVDGKIQAHIVTIEH